MTKNTVRLGREAIECIEWQQATIDKLTEALRELSKSIVECYQCLSSGTFDGRTCSHCDGLGIIPTSWTFQRTLEARQALAELDREKETVTD